VRKLRWVDQFEGLSMQVKSALAAISVAAALSLTVQAPVEAGWCRGAPVGFCRPAPVRHWIWSPNYYNVYYMATFAPDPYPYVYMPRGYWGYYDRPYARYGRRYWAPRWARAYPVPAPVPVPVGGCCGGYLK
jgi:hypothetical protein